MITSGGMSLWTAVGCLVRNSCRSGNISSDLGIEAFKFSFFSFSRTLWQRSRAHHTAELWLLGYFSQWIGTAQTHLASSPVPCIFYACHNALCNLYLLTRDRPAPQATFTEIAITRLKPDSDSNNALLATRPIHLSSLISFYIRGSVTCSVRWSMLSGCPQTNQS
ncbi:hypothetical protein DFH08DRAFT_173386 [Mycena albidolilacea]|uniref:Uncharacterized protein n=1 Tax=Mycena albidolilacea TaxID=1033008 RepID=A0AAD7F3B2_9AGAR|nr:hypothetical protein DFH08DRAFT_173386 [Mycena albidolilacea]